MRRPIQSASETIAILLAISIMFFACTSPGTNGTTSSERETEKTETWIIEYGISGGFAGINRQLTLSSNGLLTVTDGKTKKHIEDKASLAQLTKITSGLEGLDFAADVTAPSILPGRCADCFQYSLIFNGDEKKGKVLLNDISLQDSKYVSIIRLLSTMMDEALNNNIGPK